MIVAGACPHVLEVFKMTKVDSIFPVAAMVEEAQGIS